MIDEILDLPAESVRQAYRGGTLSPVDVLDRTLARIETRNPTINAFAYVDTAGARNAAQASSRRWDSGTPLSPLDGLPVTIKDSVHAVGTPWRHGCAANADLPDSTFDAPPAARLKEAGAVIVGKTTMPDFGMMAAGVSSLYGVTRNPWNPSRNTGGSSAGAGACLASGIGFSAVGSDIAGSVRLPAGHCGLVALKPTQGRIPHTAPSTMRSAGPMGRTVDDVLDMYDVLTGADPRDLWSLPPETTPLAREPLSPIGLRIGLLTTLGTSSGVEDAVSAVLADAAAALADGGADVSVMAPVFADDPYPALDRLFQVRAAAELQSIRADLRELVHPAIRDWCGPGAGLSATDFARDGEAVARSAELMRAACAGFDYVLAPVIPTVGFPAEDCGLDPSQPLGHCGFTAWFNQTAQPAAALCFGFSDGMPVGIQVVGPRFADTEVLRLTKWLEGRRPVAMAWPEPVAAQPPGGN
ncbi:amidase [Mycolicibacterium arabiense]|uniref:amidase n=1 Tax=Mycolicibacterium arabiense TaxID=1286181 RepID=A0A7I7S0Y1_9MYCO|nr:amidase [Mycolicibacterium arabiense]MCV7371850.1 amidase [Mycolicibacterium arabiense]BBY50564.1 amidase [Mycolicibacterium arabiense]